MQYTVLYAHLKERSPLSIGDLVKSGDLIGIEGSTGKSTGDHLHICVYKGKAPYPKTLALGRHLVDKKQTEYFIYTRGDKDIKASGLYKFANGDNMDFQITTGFYPDGARTYTNHYAYDTAAIKGNYKGKKGNYNAYIHWNRTPMGKVIGVGGNKFNDYGYYVMVTYEI